MKNKMRYVKLSIVALVIWIGLSGHEYLLVAEEYFLTKGDIYYIHLFVAQGFNVELERTLEKNITRNFSIITSDGIKDLKETTAEGQLPVIESVVDFDGQALITMERDHSRVELEPKKFAEYLVTDHIENINFDSNATDKNQREKYSRYIKTLLLSGNNSDGDIYKKEMGYNLEIILMDNPYKLKTGDVLKAKVLFMGSPLQNKVVTFRNRQGDENTFSTTARTNADGIVSLSIPRSGTWAIHLTHMIPCTETTDCDWESFWASYTFGIK